MIFAEFFEDAADCMTPNRDAMCKAFDQSFQVYRSPTFIVTRVRTLQAVCLAFSGEHLSPPVAAIGGWTVREDRT